jgi:hypothetical protein
MKAYLKNCTLFYLFIYTEFNPLHRNLLTFSSQSSKWTLIFIHCEWLQRQEFLNHSHYYIECIMYIVICGGWLMLTFRKNLGLTPLCQAYINVHVNFASASKEVYIEKMS